MLLLGGGAAGYALGRFVLGRPRRSDDVPKQLPQGTTLAASAIPAALAGGATPAVAGLMTISAPPPASERPSASSTTTRLASPSAQVARPTPAVATTTASTSPQSPTTAAVTAARPTAMSVTTTHTPITTIPSASEAPLAGPPSSAHPIDPYAVPSSSTPPQVLVGPPASAAAFDPYAMPSQPALTTPAPTDPITSPSQIDPVASAALGAELATVLTSEKPSTVSRRPELPSTPAHTGPITSPTQLPPEPSRVVSPPLDVEIGPVTILPSSTTVPIPSARLPRRFDAVFDRYRGSIPIEFLRALVARESSFNPSARTGNAIGLMQIIPVVLDDYNKRHGTAYQREHLVDPSINVAIGCELLRLIIASYRRFHPRVPNLQANWDNPRFVELLVLGWNAGYSEAGGVGRVARYLEARGTLDITIDLVHEHVRAAGASKHLANPAKVRWSKSVVALYLRERASSRTRRVATRSLASSH
jgi:hypothetical protein